MKNLFFLPYQVKWVGYALLIPAFFITVWLDVSSDQRAFVNLAGILLPQESALVLSLTALLLIFFSREKENNESMVKIKSEALMLAVSINYVSVLAGMLLFYGTWAVMVFYYNTCSVFLLYLLIFYWKKRKSVGN